MQNISAVVMSNTGHPQNLVEFHQTGQHRHSAGGSLRGSLRIPTGDAFPRDSFDSCESSGCQSDNAGQSPSHSGIRRSHTSSVSPRPPQSPMDLDGN